YIDFYSTFYCLNLDDINLNIISVLIFLF
ncbi:hypothetical protein LCGC14_1446100, partial [marine sediment metagenome]